MQCNWHIVPQLHIRLVGLEGDDIARRQLNWMPERCELVGDGNADIRSGTENENWGLCHSTNLSDWADRNRLVNPWLSRWA